MSYLPCKNPHCHSYGKPHPNCRCYGGHAEGGEVTPFCSEARAHNPDCEYFADGGDVKAPVMFDDLKEDAPAKPVMFDDLKEDQPSSPKESGPTMFDDLVDDKAAKYGTPDQTALAAVEGGIRGVLGPFATLAEKMAPVTMPGAEEMISPEAQAARQKENPVAFRAGEAATVVAGALTGTGQAGLINSASKAMTGSKILQGVIQGGALQASDEASKWMLGQEPQDAAGSIMSIGAAGLFGGLAAGAAEGAKMAGKKALEEVAELKFGERAMSFLQGLGEAASTQDPELRQEAAAAAAKSYGVNSAAYKAGRLFFDNIFTAGGATYGAMHGYKEGGVLGALKGAMEGAFYGYVGGKVAGKVGPAVVAPAMAKILSSSSLVGAAEALDHAAKMAQQSKLIDTSIKGLFDMGVPVSQQAISAYGSDKLHQDLDEYIGKGGVTQNMQQEIYQQNAQPAAQGFAHGGEVGAHKEPAPVLQHDNGVAIHYPEQNLLLNAARGRVSNYLLSLKPQKNQPRLAFDDEPDTREQERSYKRALAVASAPLGVLSEVKKGTIEPDHIKHLNAMYPELGGLLQKRITEQIVKAQLSGKKPPYKIRQGLSLLMGTALSSELSPMGIQAAQSVYAKAAPPQPSTQGDQKPHGSTNKLAKADQAFLTNPQALQRRAQKI